MTAKQLSHSCEKSAEIAELSTKVDAMWHSLEGNGQPGLKHTLIELNVTVKDLKIAVERSSTAQANLKIKRTGWIIAGAGVVITFVNILLTHL